jgi:hypothetical protein
MQPVESSPGHTPSFVIVLALFALSIAPLGCSGNHNSKAESTRSGITNSKPARKAPPPPDQVRKTLAKASFSRADLDFLEGTAFLRCQQSGVKDLANLYRSAPNPRAVAFSIARSWTHSLEARVAIRRGCLDALTEHGG